MAPRRVADRQLEERHQLARTRPGARHDAEICVVHAAPHPARDADGSFDKFGGEVEVDETYIGGKARNMHKDVRKRKITGDRRCNGKTAVIGMLERGGKVRARRRPDTSARTLHGDIRDTVEAGATVYTDALPSYTRP